MTARTEIPWSPDDDAILMRLWAEPALKLRVMMAELPGRSRAAIAGRARRLGLPKKRPGRHGSGARPLPPHLRPPRPPPPKKGPDFHRPSDPRISRAEALLLSGRAREDVATETGLCIHTVNRLGQLCDIERAGTSWDSSCPKFAEHERFCAAVTAHGGMPRIMERNGRMLPFLIGPDNRPWRERRV